MNEIGFDSTEPSVQALDSLLTSFFLFPGVVTPGAARLLPAGDAGTARPPWHRLWTQVRAVHHRGSRQRSHPALLHRAGCGSSQGQPTDDTVTDGDETSKTFD